MRRNVSCMLILLGLILALPTLTVFSAAREDGKGDLKLEIEKQYLFISGEGAMVVDAEFKDAKFFAIEDTVDEEFRNTSALDLGAEGVLVYKAGKGSSLLYQLTNKGWKKIEMDKKLNSLGKDNKGNIIGNEYDAQTRKSTRWIMKIVDGKIEWEEMASTKPGKGGRDGIEKLPIERIKEEQIQRIQDIRAIKAIENDADGFILPVQDADMEDRAMEKMVPVAGWRTQNSFGSGENSYEFQRYFDIKGGESIKFRIIKNGEEKPISEFEMKNDPKKNASFFVSNMVPGNDDAKIILIGQSTTWEARKTATVLSISRDSGKTWNDLFPEVWEGRGALLSRAPLAD